MGIDVFMHWEGQERRDLDAGYLREAYFSSDHHATHVLVPEGWGESDDELGVPIPAATLAERMEAVAYACTMRYPDDPDRAREHLERFVAFVELAKRKEAATGEPVKIKVSW